MPAGYKIDLVATGLTFPTALAFDDEGGLYVVEGGWAYGGARDVPRLLKVQGPTTFVTIATGESAGPWTGVAFVPGATGKGSGSFYIADGGAEQGGRILRVGTDGSIEPLLEKLPSLGDHHTNGPVLGPDGMLYFGQGTATNSGIVGVDNSNFGWLAKHKDFHDTPCQDITLNGENFETHDPFNKEAKAKTGAFGHRGHAFVAEFGDMAPQVGKVLHPVGFKIARVDMERGIAEDFAVNRKGSGPASRLGGGGLERPVALRFSPDGSALYIVDFGVVAAGAHGPEAKKLTGAVWCITRDVRK